jgi:uncharacterized protein YcfL
MKHLLRLLSIGIYLVMIGCVGQQTASLISDPRLHVDSNLNSGVIFSSIIDDITPGGFTEIQLSGFNHSTSVCKIEYRVTWFDTRGMAVDSILSRWQRQTLINDMPFQIQAISPNTTIGSFLIQIREEGARGFEESPETAPPQG